MKQGDVVWVDFGEPVGSEAAYRRPAVIIQNDRFNDSRLATVIVCPVTSSLRRKYPGCVELGEGEGGLPKPSIVEPWLVTAIARADLGEPIGELPEHRIVEVLRGLNLYVERR